MKKQLLILMFAIIGFSANAQWQLTNGPFGGTINCIADSGSFIFAGTPRGLFRSTNGGTSWTFDPVFTGFEEIFSLAISGNTVFAGGAANKVYISNSNGAPNTWTGVLTPGVGAVTSILVNGGTVYAGTSSGGVVKSTDNGVTWTLINGGLNNNINSLVKCGNYIFRGTNGGGVEKNLINSFVWTPVNTGLGNTATVNCMAVSDSNIYVGVLGGVYLSTNLGASWTIIGMSSYIINSLAVNGSNIIAGTEGHGVYVSADTGATWTAMNNGMYNNTIVTSISVNGGNVFAGTTGRGVYLSNNNCASWSETNNGLTATIVQALTSIGNTVFSGTNAGGVYTTVNGGASWIPADSGLNNTLGSFSLATSGDTAYAGVNSLVYKSTDYGTSWNLSGYGTSYDVRAIVISGNTFFAGTDGGDVYQSTNRGSNWTSHSSGLPSTISTSVFSLAIIGNIVMAGTIGNGVYSSAINGTSWGQLSSGFSNNNIYALATCGSTILAGTAGGGLYSSTNGGATWLNYLNGNIRAFATTGNIAFAASDVSIYLSTNNGISWSYIQPNNGFGYENIYSLAINGGYLYVGTDYGKVWKCQLSAFGITTVGIQESTNNADFTISPNPFTSQTTISFSEPQKNTIIKIMDVVGKEIKTVMFSGKSLILEKGEMQSGVYFVQITDENKKVTNKKIIMQ